MESTLTIHPDHTRDFMVNAPVQLVYLSTDAADAEANLPTPGCMTQASDGTFAVWKFTPQRTR